MREFLWFAGLLAALLLSFVSSGMETSLYRASRVRMRIRAERGDGRASLVLRVLDNLDAMVTAILIGNNIAAYAGTYFLSRQLVEWGVGNPALLATGIITPLFFVLTESLPKQIAYSRADFLAAGLVRAFLALKLSLSPMVWILNRSSALLRRLLGVRGVAGISQSRRNFLIERLNAGVAEHVLSPEQSRMAARIMQLERLQVSESMIPLAGIARVSESANRGRALAAAAGGRDSVALLVDASGVPTGMAITADALLMAPGGPEDSLAGVAEKLERVSARSAISDVLALFRNRHARRALVVEKDRIVGMATTRTVLDLVAGMPARSKPEAAAASRQRRFRSIGRWGRRRREPDGAPADSFGNRSFGDP